jgi:hypothetical protein
MTSIGIEWSFNFCFFHISHATHTSHTQCRNLVRIASSNICIVHTDTRNSGHGIGFADVPSLASASLGLATRLPLVCRQTPQHTS